MLKHRKVFINIVLALINMEGIFRDTSESELNRRIKGSIAEKIFHLLHSDMNCIVYNSGHEYLFPNLIITANVSKKIWNKNYIHYEAGIVSRYTDIPEKFVKDYINKLRLSFADSGFKVATIPDFVIVTYKGNILEFEVKYREDGKLTDDDKFNIINKYPKAIIFLVSAVPPYISFHKVERIKFGTIEEMKEHDNKYNTPIVIPCGTEETEEQFKVKIYQLLQEKKITESDEDFYFNILYDYHVNRHFNSENSKIKDYKSTGMDIYKLPENDDGAITVFSSTTNDFFEYPMSILNKYKKLVTKWLKKEII